MRTLILILLTIVVLLHHANAAFGKTNKVTKALNLCFIENKGQIKDQNGRVRKDINFKLAAGPGLNIFIGNGNIHYQFSKPDSSCGLKGFSFKKAENDGKVQHVAEQYDMYRMDVQLENTNKDAQIIVGPIEPYMEQYSLSENEKMQCNSSSFSKVTYKNIYPKIDWVLYIKDNHLEYDFVVHPGGNVNDIKLNYTGATRLQQSPDMITAFTPLGKTGEVKLYGYQQEDGHEIACKFCRKDNYISFAVAAHTGTLVLDPTLDWATYFAGTSDQHANCIAYGDSGCVYIAGYTSSTSNIATSGAFSTAFSGVNDAYLAKFDSTGRIRWATYYGGTGSDEARAVSYDGGGNVYISGLTFSTGGIATPGTHQSSYGGGGDAFLAKFSIAGIRVWGTYYGGGDVDYTTGMCIDKAGHIYITGRTLSVDSIATPGAYETTSGDSASTCGFIAKFNDSGNVIWATYYRGDDDVEPQGICSDDTGNIYIAGTTGSTIGIATPGAYLDSLDSIVDDAGFIAKFSSQGLRRWGTYYGSGGSNLVEAITCDKSGNTYVTGSTYCTGHIATPGSYKSSLTGDANGFLSRFSSAGNMEWGTYFGNAGDGSNSVTLDTAGNVYMAGLTTSLTGIATAGAYQATFAGGQDAFLAEFSPAGALKWGTYFGGPDYDEAFGVVCDKNGYVYIAGSTKSATGVATTGAFDTSFTAATNGNDVFLARFGPVRTNHTAIKQLSENIPAYNIYPDPAKDVMHISFKGFGSTDRQLIILNTKGQQVLSEILPGSSDEIIVSVKDLVAGDYFIILNIGGARYTKKLAIVR